MNRPFLKWPGGKSRLMPYIAPRLPQGKTLIEPFVGAGAVFLNTDYDHYILNDINQDLISLYKILKAQKKTFIHYCHSFFTSKNNTEKRYYFLRKKFCPGI